MDTNPSSPVADHLAYTILALPQFAEITPTRAEQILGQVWGLDSTDEASIATFMEAHVDEPMIEHELREQLILEF